MELQTFEQFAERYALRMKVKEVEAQPEEQWVPGVRAYEIKIKSVAFPKSFKLRYKCGPACGEPELWCVLHSIQCDAHSAEYCLDEYDFIDEYGYRDKPREGAAIYAACQEQLEKCRKFFGYAVTEELMKCTE